MTTIGRQRIRGFCALCKSRCGCISTVEDGRLVAVDPDPEHPTGARLCAKGRAAPEIVHSPERLLHPMRRTRPKGDPDPGWERVSWDAALDAVASALREIAASDGPEAVAFASTSPSASGISDHIGWVHRLVAAFGSPNLLYSTEICNWHKDDAAVFTYGAATGAPDVARAGCLVLWGHNPSTGWLASATAMAEARARGCRLVVVDPRPAGLANKADRWLRVRPGTDGALALGIAGCMIGAGWYDAGFVRGWTNGPLLVRRDTGRFLRASEIGAPGDGFVVLDDASGLPRPVAPRPGDGGHAGAALTGRVSVGTPDGPVDCAPAFQLYADLCGAYPPARVEAVTGVPAEDVVAAARLMWEARPTAFYAWSGVGQHTNATQTNRAIAMLHALTGDHDAPGGNLVLEGTPANDVSGRDLLDGAQRAKALGLDARPLGPGRNAWITCRDFRRAVLERRPYPVRGLVAFGSNLLMSQAGASETARALAALRFHVHLDLFMNPTAAHADIVLPVTSPWEHEGLRLGFDGTPEAQAHVQLRRRVVAARGEARSDGDLIFDLARRLGLADRFFGGSLDAGTAHVLAPSGVTMEALRAAPGGLGTGRRHRHRKYVDAGGFATPTGRIEIYSERLHNHGQAPLPAFVEPAVSPVSRPDLASAFPLVLTSAKSPLFCQSQHRGIPALRRQQPDPVVEIHPATAAGRGIRAGDWVRIATPAGAARARARVNARIDPGVVCAQHGWWQACRELDRPGFAAVGETGANYNQLIDDAQADPISGSVALRSYLCEVSPLA